jgi:adenosylmethionine-8-amino-7-oxononanoate aminotransferase
MKYQGIIPSRQQQINPALPFWQYGTIDQGRKIVDPHLHTGCFVVGYQNQEILDYVMQIMQSNRPEIAESYIRDESLYLNHVSFEFAARLHALTGGYRPFFALSGSDANEGAIKLAAAYHHYHGQPEKNIIVGFEKSYHGSTWMTMSIGSDSLFRDPFYNFDRYHNIVRLTRDFDADRVDWTRVACVMLETCSYGTGFQPESDEFWQQLRYVQTNHDVLIVVDDIFMGGGKTGNYVGWKNLPVTPDIFTMGKAITAGFFPLATTLCTEHIYDAVKNLRWEHGFTYNFNLSGIASAMKYLDILERDQLLQDHDVLVQRARAVFADQQIEIINQFGLNFVVRLQDKSDRFYLLPINATSEYFDTLAENLAHDHN